MKTLLGAALAAAMPTFLSTAHAQEGAIMLAPVSVTATKTEKLTSEAPASVSVVTEKQIEERNAERVDQALQGTLGVFTRGAGDGTPSAWSNQILLRGVPSYTRTAVLVDGQGLGNGFSSGSNLSAIPMDSVQQIEVVPGPFSSLYGGAAMGGVVNVITKVPTTRETTVTLGYGSYQTHSEALSHRDRLAFTDSSLGLAFHLDHSGSEGYVNDYVTKTASGAGGGGTVTGASETTSTSGARAFLTGDKGRVGWYKNNLGLKLFYDWGQDSKLTLEGNYHDHSTLFDHSNLYLRDGSGNAVPPGATNTSYAISGAGANVTTRQYDYLASFGGEEAQRYRTTYETGLGDDMTLKASIGHLRSGYWYSLADQTATDAAGQGKYSDIPNTRTDFDLSLGAPLGNSHYLLAGAYVGLADLDKTDYLLGNWKEVSSRGRSVYNSNAETMTKAVYVQDEMALTDQATLYMGARYDHWSTSGSVHQQAYTFRGTTYNAMDTTYDERTKGAISPKASLSYKLDADSTLRAAWGRAFRAPSLSDMYSGFATATGFSYSSPDLKPEKSRSWEVGGEHTVRATNTLLKGTYFNTQIKDLIYSYTSGNDTYKANAGGAHIQGFEVEARQHLVDKLFAFANLTVQDSRITNNTARPNSVGKRTTLTPDKMWNVGIEGDWRDFFGSLMVQHVSKIYSSDESTDVAEGVPGAYDPYTIVNTKLGWHLNDTYTATFAVNNLFDKTYYSSSMMPGRTFFLGLKATY